MEMCAVDKLSILKELSAVEFAAWELHLYLDTHKCDEKALTMSKKYKNRANELRAEYEQLCGPISYATGSGEDWIKGPWPWEYKECGC